MDANTTATATSTQSGLDVHLGPFGQSPFLQIYTQISFIFPVSDPSLHDSIIKTLQKGLQRLSESVPWVAGQVIHKPGPEGSSGVYKIQAHEKTPHLVVKDLRDDTSAPTMESLRRAEFPMSMLDEDVIAPGRTIPGGPNYDPEAPKPVTTFQLNWIVGGLIFTMNGQHATMDMVGQGEIIRLLSKACKNEPFTADELATQNLDRQTAVPLLDDSYQLGDELVEQIFPSPPQPPASTDTAPPKAIWVYFSFDPKSLVRLKAEAAKSLDASTPFISTDDALTALIWQATTRARLPHLDPRENTKMSRAVDVRAAVGVPKGYPLLQNMTYNNEAVGDILHAPLGIIASKLRSQLDPKQLRYRTQALATFLNRLPDKSGYSATALSNPATDVMLSSWVRIDSSLDFNFGLGKPESVRRPRFIPFESLMYLMPKAPNGEISLALALREDDVERLKMDEEFTKYARYIG